MPRSFPLVAVGLALALATACALERRTTASGEGNGDGNPGDPPGGSYDPCEPGAQRCDGGRSQSCGDDARWDIGEACGNSRRVCVDGRGCVDADDVSAEGEGEGANRGEGEGEGGERNPGEGEGEGPPVPEGGECAPGRRECRELELHYCLNSAEWAFEIDCGERGQTCEQGECVGCEAGTRTCIGNSIMVCEDDGRTIAEVELCAPGSVCLEGQCVRSCGVHDGKISYQGCEYWAVDLDNADIQGGGISPADGQFAVVVSNVNEEAVTVTVYKSDNGDDEIEILEREIGAGAVEVLNLPARSQVGSGKSFKAYRVAADQPVIAYQFNPLNNTDQAFSNDASLLIPSNALGSEYIAVTGDGMTGSDGRRQLAWGAYVTVVGVQEAPVEVRVEATALIAAPRGAGIEVDGNVVTATLRRFEVLSVHSQPPQQLTRGAANLSGTRITADGPIAVFAGNVATGMPLQDPFVCCADHLEEQLWPVASWGRQFVGGRSLVRRESNPEDDFWRVTGSVDGTVLTWRPRRPRGAPERLDSGESVELQAPGHFVVEADEPILLAHFLTSSQWGVEGLGIGFCFLPGEGDEHCQEQLGVRATCQDGNCRPISDPSMILIPPTEQFRDSYVFLTPADYATDFINVIAPVGAIVRLDDVIVGDDSWEPVAEMGGQSWQVATLVVVDGRHTVNADAPVGLLVHGYDADVSYGYPGGLDLESINENPPPPRE